MGLEEIVNGSAAQFEDVTVAELIQQYGEKPVRRGLSYMASLSDAEQSYINSLDEREYEESVTEGLTGERSSNGSEPANKWAERAKEEGIGLDE